MSFDCLKRVKFDYDVAMPDIMKFQDGVNKMAAWIWLCIRLSYSVIKTISNSFSFNISLLYEVFISAGQVLLLGVCTCSTFCWFWMSIDSSYLTRDWIPEYVGRILCGLEVIPWSLMLFMVRILYGYIIKVPQVSQGCVNKRDALYYTLVSFTRYVY